MKFPLISNKSVKILIEKMVRVILALLKYHRLSLQEARYWKSRDKTSRLSSLNFYSKFRSSWLSGSTITIDIPGWWICVGNKYPFLALGFWSNKSSLGFRIISNPNGVSTCLRNSFSLNVSTILNREHWLAYSLEIS